MTMPDFEHLVDLERMRLLLEAQSRITGLRAAILDARNNPLVAMPGPELCERFHRPQAVAGTDCCEIESLIREFAATYAGDEGQVFRCRHGLRAFAVPIVVDGRRLATYCSGRYYQANDKPDAACWREQARNLGLDENACLAAVDGVPVLTPEQERDHVDFARNLVQSLVEAGVKNLGMKDEISRRRASEQEASFFRTLVEKTGDPIFVLDPADGFRMVYVNPAACRHFGMDPETILRMRLHEWDPLFDEERIAEMLRERTYLQPLLIETVHRVASGKLVPVEVTSSPLEYGGRLLTAGFFHDISERKAIEASLREKDLLLLQQSRMAAMGEMISYIAHQWRQPLNIIGLFAQTLEIACGKPTIDRAYVTTAMEKITEVVQHMSATIDDFRNFFRTDQDPQLFDLKDICGRIIAFIAEALKLENIEIVCSAPQAVVAMGYPNEFWHVLLNLLNNAKEALIERGVAAPRIALEIGREENRAVVRVRDNSGGIPPDCIDRIFDRYFSTKGDGTGLGLYISKIIIEKRMAGCLTVCNVDGGAEFRIELPVA